MSNSVLEIKLTDSMPILPESRIAFNEQLLYPTGIAYNKSTGIITFNETGQYSIKWWVATETTLKGPIGFQLISSQGSFAPTPGCSPIKTGQITGFGAIDVQTTDTTLSLINASTTNTVVISRKAGTKAYLMITPIAPPPVRVYRGNISTSGSFLQVPLGNGIYYRLEYLSSTSIRLALSPISGPIKYDYRRLSGVDGFGAMEGSFDDSGTLSGSTIIDTPIYNNSREMHWVLIRMQDPVSNLWSLYEVRHFVSGLGARATVWVNTIEEGVSY